MQIFKNPNYDFVKFRHKAFIFSGLCIAITIGAFVYNKGFNLAIDFVGGTLVHVKFEKPVENDIATIRTVVGNLGFGSPKSRPWGSPAKAPRCRSRSRKRPNWARWATKSRWR